MVRNTERGLEYMCAIEAIALKNSDGRISV